MIKRVMVCALFIVCVASVASAQRNSRTSSYGSTSDHRAELIPLGGYAWTTSIDVRSGLTYGVLDFKDAGFFGVALDVNTMNRSGKEGQLRLLYRRSNSQVQYRSLSKNVDQDASVEYWHIGGLGGVRRGNTLPYASFTLGATRLMAGGEDSWKFSTILGLGVKAYMSPKIGLMVQGNWAFTWTDVWGGVTVGTGGAGVGVTGTGISQFDVGGGLIICF